MHACSVTQLCPALCNSMDCSSLSSSVHRIFPARILEWVATYPLQGIFLTQGSNLSLLHYRRILYRWATGHFPIESHCLVLNISSLCSPGPISPAAFTLPQVKTGIPSTHLQLPEPSVGLLGQANGDRAGLGSHQQGGGLTGKPPSPRNCRRWKKAARELAP